MNTWKDKQTGATHKATLTIGAVFVSPKGAQVIRLDAWPTSPDFSGWVAMKPIIMPKSQRASIGMPPAPSDPEPGAPDPDADIPF